jgi:hypothetical protein
VLSWILVSQKTEGQKDEYKKPIDKEMWFFHDKNTLLHQILSWPFVWARKSLTAILQAVRKENRVKSILYCRIYIIQI